MNVLSLSVKFERDCKNLGTNCKICGSNSGVAADSGGVGRLQEICNWVGELKGCDGSNQSERRVS